MGFCLYGVNSHEPMLGSERSGSRIANVVGAVRVPPDPTYIHTFMHKEVVTVSATPNEHHQSNEFALLHVLNEVKTDTDSNKGSKGAKQLYVKETKESSNCAYYVSFVNASVQQSAKIAETGTTAMKAGTVVSSNIAVETMAQIMWGYIQDGTFISEHRKLSGDKGWEEMSIHPAAGYFYYGHARIYMYTNSEGGEGGRTHCSAQVCSSTTRSPLQRASRWCCATSTTPRSSTLHDWSWPIVTALMTRTPTRTSVSTAPWWMTYWGRTRVRH